MKEQWDKFWAKKCDSKFAEESWAKRRIVGILERYIKTGMRVLDAGCGSGFFSKCFMKKGCFVYACDYSHDAINLTIQTTENKCVAYLKKDLLDKEVWNEFIHFFDVIFTDGLFEHFSHEQQQKLIENFIKLKRDNGLIITFVPNKLSWWTIIRPLFMPGIDEKPFTMDGLRMLHSPLKIIECGGINTLPIRYSPDKILGSRFGMLIYVIAK